MTQQARPPENGSHAPYDVLPVPQSALEALALDVEAAGGPLRERPEDAAGAGRTMFDTPGSEDTTLIVLVPRERMRELPSQALVRIESREDRRSYLGVVVAGPFAEPDGLRGDAPVVVTAAVNGGMFLPRYHGRVQVEILGEQLGETLVPPRFRPLPNSVVFPLSAEETARVLRAGGDVRIGLAVGHDDVTISIDSTRKDVLPRHTAILGTTGGGKSTTMAGLIAGLQAAGVAVVLLDTEGEYTYLNEPTDDATMVRALARLDREPAGVPNTHVFHLVGRDPANPDHPDVRPFRLRFCDLAPETVMEILELNDAQQHATGSPMSSPRRCCASWASSRGASTTRTSGGSPNWTRVRKAIRGWRSAISTTSAPRCCAPWHRNRTGRPTAAPPGVTGRRRWCSNRRRSRTTNP